MVLNKDNAEVVANATENRPLWLAAATGLNAAIAVSYLICKPPQAHTLSVRSRLFTSALYIFITCLAGILGTRIALSRGSRNQLRSLALWGARGWLFLPATMIFLRMKSIWAPIVVVVSAALMATYLNRMTVAPTGHASERTKPHHDVEKNIFITQLRFEPISLFSFGASLCLYGTLTSAIAGKIALSTLLLGAGSFLLVSQITSAQSITEHEEQRRLNQRSHTFSLIASALLCAFVALSVAASTSRLYEEMRAFHVGGLPTPRSTKQSSEKHSSEGYRTIVLWPILKKEKLIPSPPLNIGTFTRSTATPWVIPFYGPYWYFKISGESPGPLARTTRGDPLKVNVRSTDSAPLLMEAHQYLSEPVDLTCCREIQIVFRNDVSLGASHVGISLADSHSKAKVPQSLGMKSIASSDVGQSPASTSPVEETVSFALPVPGAIKKFDQITVILLPHHRYSTAGRRVAIERFVMIPN